jgi:hypothetical protein
MSFYRKSQPNLSHVAETSFRSTRPYLISPLPAAHTSERLGARLGSGRPAVTFAVTVTVVDTGAADDGNTAETAM